MTRSDVHDLVFLLSAASVLDRAVEEIHGLDAIKTSGAFEYAETGSRAAELAQMWEAARAVVHRARNGEIPEQDPEQVSVELVSSLMHMREEMMEAAARCLDALGAGGEKT